MSTWRPLTRQILFVPVQPAAQATTSDLAITPTLAGDGVADDGPAIAAALATGKPVVLKPAAVHYRLNSPLVLPAGATLIGIGNPALVFYGTTTGQRGVVETGGANVRIEGLTIDARRRSQGNGGWLAALKVMHDNTHMRDVHVRDSGWRGTWWIGVKHCSWIGGSSRFHSGPGLALWGVSFSKFAHLDLSDNANFGVHMEDGTNNCHLEALTAYNAGNNFMSLELVGMVFSCFRNKILNCFAEGTGDNGISITGYRNIVSGNHCIGNTYAGIDVYGSENVVTGNYCANNNQRRLTTHPKHVLGEELHKHPGIGVKAFWGGMGARNTITGNVCVDTQDVPTQYFGVYINSTPYPNWTANWDVNYLSYAAHNGNVYKCRISSGASGVTGSTPPTHTAGTVYPEGETVGWEYLGRYEGNTAPKHNVLASNVCTGNIARQTYDATNNANQVTDDNLISLKGPGTYNYRTTIETFSGDPNSAQRRARTGSMVMRLNGPVGNNIYVKEFGDLTTDGWTPLMARRAGDSSSRPTPAADAIGYVYFDVSLGKPIWWTGAGWVDAAGAQI